MLVFTIDKPCVGVKTSEPSCKANNITENMPSALYCDVV